MMCLVLRAVAATALLLAELLSAMDELVAERHVWDEFNGTGTPRPPMAATSRLASVRA